MMRNKKSLSHQTPDRGLSHGSRASRLLLRMLRHDPATFDLDVDKHGWVDSDRVLHAINARAQLLGLWREWTIRDLQQLACADAGQRLEIAAGRIRARYGHSLRAVNTGVMRVPPKRLYHGTSVDRLWSISLLGLRPGGRRFVQLTSDADYARDVAAAKEGCPYVLVILAREAAANRRMFLQATETVWYVERLHPAFLLTIPFVRVNELHDGDALREES